MFRFVQNHPQGANLCLAKTTAVVTYSRRLLFSQCAGSILASCVAVWYTVVKDGSDMKRNMSEQKTDF
jgi:hypothetical protein